MEPHESLPQDSSRLQAGLHPPRSPPSLDHYQPGYLKTILQAYNHFFSFFAVGHSLLNCSKVAARRLKSNSECLLRREALKPPNSRFPIYLEKKNIFGPPASRSNFWPKFESPKYRKIGVFKKNVVGLLHTTFCFKIVFKFQKRVLSNMCDSNKKLNF